MLEELLLNLLPSKQVVVKIELSEAETEKPFLNRVGKLNFKYYV